MELRQVEHFLALVDEKRFTRAARRSHLSQSALSASIRALERELGTPLFLRTTRGVEVTEAGRALLDNAREILRVVALAEEAVAASQDRVSGSLNMGGIQTVGVLDQAKLLADFHVDHPQVEITYVTGSSPDLLDRVAAGRLDLGFVTVPARPPHGVELELLAIFPLAVVCRPDHPLAQSAVIDLDALADQTIVGGPRGNVANDVVDRVYRRAGSSRRATLHVGDVTSMLEFAAHGLGVALLPQELVRPPLVAVPIADADMVWNVGVATAPAGRRKRATEILLEMVRALGSPR